MERLSTIRALVEKTLGQYKEGYDIIRDKASLRAYVDACVEAGVVSIDTETTGLDPITDTLAGVSMYTPGQPAVYVPLHHVSYVTGVEVDNQVPDEDMVEALTRLKDADTKVIMFNAKFDLRVLRNQLGVKLTADWDGYLAARLLNENEPENGLKALHKKYILQGEGDAFSFDHLFKGIPFTYIPINTGYVYAARDAEITYQLYEFQKEFLDETNSDLVERDLDGVAYVFNHIEMPLIEVVAEMEDRGIAFDFEYAQDLSDTYNAQLEEVEEYFYEQLQDIKKELDEYRLRLGHLCKLEDPVNIGSPSQVAILLYDVLKLENPEGGRGTGEAILLKLKHPIVDTILKYRGIAKLLSTYIDKMPNIVNPKTGRIHASFNQIGADTGRFSSSNPNMQNIPSHNSEIRKMFTATEGHVLLSSDYSAQEPRLTAHMSQDAKMIQAYKDGKDLYVEIASIAYNLPYEDCQEFKADGTPHPEGKERRTAAKAIVLGIVYGKGVPAIADDLNVSRQVAQTIYNKVMKSFPGLQVFMDESQTMARELGYVTTAWGRKRRLPNMQLPMYEFSYVGGAPASFDPLFDDETEVSFEVDERLIAKYTRLMDRSYGRAEKERVRRMAKEEGILIKDNGGFIAEATRQCVNSRIQGSAADQTKLAMILVGNDEKLKELGFKLLLAVHDELIGECPRENASEVAQRFSQLMVDAAKDLLVPSKCDVEVTERWYGDRIEI